MEQILFVNACARPGSRTLELAQHVLQTLNGQVEELRLYEERIPPLDLEGLQARDAALAAGDQNAPILRHAVQLARADVVVLAAPYWDLGFPSVVRIWLEAVTAAGVTFRYDMGRPVGLCRAKKLIYVTTAGGPVGENNLGYDYVRALAEGLYGIPETVCVKAEGLDMDGADPAAILNAVKLSLR